MAYFHHLWDRRILLLVPVASLDFSVRWELQRPQGVQPERTLPIGMLQQVVFARIALLEHIAQSVLNYPLIATLGGLVETLKNRTFRHVMIVQWDHFVKTKVYLSQQSVLPDLTLIKHHPQIYKFYLLRSLSGRVLRYIFFGVIFKKRMPLHPLTLRFS